MNRLESSTPAMARVTHINTKACMQTFLTLQDGCFGAATLMRIAALVVKLKEVSSVRKAAEAGAHASEGQGGSVAPDQAVTASIEPHLSAAAASKAA